MASEFPRHRSRAWIFSAVVISTFVVLWEWGVPVPDMFQKEMAGRRLLAEQDRSTQSGNCAPNASRYVLLVAYSRSGSSLTSDIISRHPDVFAYFEPLHTLARIFRSQQVEFENRTKKHLYLTRMNDYNLLATQVLENQMTCNYGNLSRLALLNPLMTYYYSTKLLYDCVRRSRTPQAEKYCLMTAEERCKQKPIRLMKTVRFSIDQAGVLLKSHPCAKLIFLIKDPRGSFQSKIRMFDFYGKNPVDFNVQRFCWRFQKDLDSANKLKETYPGRVYITRFENFAMRPILSTKRLFNFLGLEMTKGIQTFVQSKTHSKVDRAGYSTSRADAFKACYRWRQSIPFNVVKAYDKFCRQPFSELGYLPVNSTEELRNFGVSLLSDRDNFP